MRSPIVVSAIVLALLASAVVAQGYSLPWRADFPPGQPCRSGGPPLAPAPAGPHGGPGGIDFLGGFSGIDFLSQFSSADYIGGFSSVDFLGEVRKQLDTGRLSSLFPFTWFMGKAAGGPDRAEYLGFTYERASDASRPGSHYYSGEKHEGRRIYVPASGNSPGTVPDLILLGYGDGHVAYAISGKPAVYAYVPFGAFNANETVRFGLANDGPATVDLPNAAPYEIQRNEGGAWRTVFSPMAAQVITRVPNGARKEWSWGQRLDDGAAAPFGEYRVVIAGKYVAPFRIAPDVPVVERPGLDLDRAAARAIAGSSPALRAIAKAYPSPSSSERDEVVSVMQHKAWALGLDPERLRRAIEAAGTDRLPCMAIHASFEGTPAWIILYCPDAGAAAPSLPEAFVAEDAAGAGASGAQIV